MVSANQRAPGKRDRTFTGCWRCRSRKVKCDEQQPHCRACQRLGAVCDGYSARLAWVEGEGQRHRSDGRRRMECASTWGDLPVLDVDLVDRLILDCDTEIQGTLKGRSTHSPPTFNPFGVFQAWVYPVKTHPLLSDVGKLLAVDPTDPTSRSSEARFLFHHYISYVSSIMIPYSHPRNPWNSSYPAVARCYKTPEQKALYNAMLAHAAYSLSGLCSSPSAMAVVAIKYYTNALEHLKSGLLNEKRDYGATLAAVMTLTMAEVYNGRPGTWKQHLKGAWTLLGECSTDQPWTASDFACCSTQSLYIIKILSETCQVREPTSCSINSWAKDRFLRGYLAKPNQSKLGDDAIPEDFLGCRISSTLDFGFTLGSPKSLLRCISAINLAAEKMQSPAMSCQEEADWTDEVVSGILSRLNAVQGEYADDNISLESQNGQSCEEQNSALARYQSEAFISATYIYFYRVLFDLPPFMVRQNVSEVFTCIHHFCSVPNRNLSIWPAFIAAVEAYTFEDKSLAREWLNHATSFGIGSRNSVRKVVEEVWKRREEAASETGIEEGLIAVDWREVMSDLGLDILLV